MTNAPPNTSTENQEAAIETKLPVSNYQPVIIFCLLYVFSFGVYAFFWFYKHWLYLRDEKQENIDPRFKASFIPFSGFGLFKRFRRLAVQEGYTKKPPLFLFFVLYIVGIFTVVFLNTLLGLLISFFSFLWLIPALRLLNFYYLKAQPHHKLNKGLAWDEWLFLAVVWAVLFYAVFIR